MTKTSYNKMEKPNEDNFEIKGKIQNNDDFFDWLISVLEDIKKDKAILLDSGINFQPAFFDDLDEIDNNAEKPDIKNYTVYTLNLQFAYEGGLCEFLSSLSDSGCCFSSHLNGEIGDTRR